MTHDTPAIARRSMLAGGVLLVTAAPAAGMERLRAPTRLVEQTYLKAAPGQRANLARYVVANWFVMDQLATEAGFFTSYQLVEDIDANPDWDLVMIVGYPQAQGYDDPATMAAFKAIRATHVEIPIDGKTLGQLGSIVQHHRLKIVA